MQERSLPVVIAKKKNLNCKEVYCKRNFVERIHQIGYEF